MAACPAPKPLKARTKGKLAGKTKAEVAMQLRKSNWTAMALLPDLFRITGGGAKAAVLYAIYFETLGEPHKGLTWKPKRYSVPLIPADFAKMTGFSEATLREAIEECIDEGMADRSCGCAAATRACGSPQHYQFRLLIEGWRDLPNAFETREGAFRKPAKSEGLEEDPEAAPDPDAESEEKANPAIAIVRVMPTRKEGSPVSPGKVQAVAKMDWRGSTLSLECQNDTELPIVSSTTVTAAGAIRVVIRPKVAGIHKFPTPVDLVRAISDGLADRELAMPLSKCGELVQAMAPCKSAAYFFERLDVDRVKVARKRQVYTLNFVHVVAQDVAGSWPAAEAAKTREAQSTDLRRADEEARLGNPSLSYSEPTKDDLLAECDRRIVDARTQLKAAKNSTEIARAEDRLGELRYRRQRLVAGEIS